MLLLLDNTSMLQCIALPAGIPGGRKAFHGEVSTQGQSWLLQPALNCSCYGGGAKRAFVVCPTLTCHCLPLLLSCLPYPTLPLLLPLS